MTSSAGAAQTFRAGQEATARVIGSRPLDGMAVVSLKPSVVQQTLMSYDELAAGQKARPAAEPAAGAPAVLPRALLCICRIVACSRLEAGLPGPGAQVTGTIAAIDERGATLTLAPGIKYVAQLRHHLPLQPSPWLTRQVLLHAVLCALHVRQLQTAVTSHSLKRYDLR